MKLSDGQTHTTTYDYTDRGVLWHLTDRACGITTYEYWDNGLLKKMTYPNGAYAEYAYNERNWLTTLTHRKSDETLIAGFSYEYDPTYWGKNGTRMAQYYLTWLF
jgi:uncharacterized protein RhaS with RHS repeats